MDFCFSRCFACLALLMPLTGCGVPSFLVTPISGSSELQEITVTPAPGWAPKKIAIIEVEGLLLNVKTGAILQPVENPLSLFVQQLNKAADDDSVKAVVLRVNSPGGAVATSDTMYDCVLKFRKKTGKPVIAAAQEVDASGAYYLSCACDRIVAHPAGVIGSIGVIFQTFEIADAMAKIGLTADAIKSAPMKDIGSPFKRMTPDERAVLQLLVDEYFVRFKSVVTSHRPIKPDGDGVGTINEVANGRVFSGEQAVKLGLADQVGRLDDAVDLAKRLAKSPDAKVVMYKRPYGYSGSIYADTSVSAPQANNGGVTIGLPLNRAMLPMGFYYVWLP